MVNVPQFTMGANILPSFMQGAQGVSNALAQWQNRNQQAEAFAMQRDRMAQQDKQWQASNALAQAQLGIQQRTADRADALAPFDLKYRQSMIDYNRARINALAMRGQPAASTPQTPQTVQGMREDGSIYELPAPRAESRVLSDSANVPNTVTREHSYYGPYGQMALDVPGVVVNEKGSSDQFATMEAKGQRAADTLIPPADRERFERFARNQELWTARLGKPKSGFMYDMQGRQVPTGPMPQYAQLNEQRDKAMKIVQSQIDDAEKTLLKSWNITRSLAAGSESLGAVGRFIRPEVMDELNQAFSKYKEGTLQMVYALSGKQTTNKEMENFLEMYQPRAGESDKLIQAKTRRLKRMLTTLQSNVKKGMVYDEAERHALTTASRDDPNSPMNTQRKALREMSTEDLLRQLDGQQ